MRGLALGLALVAACYAPKAPVQVPCSLSGECPTGQMCVEGTCVVEPGMGGMGGDAPLAADRDGDGRADDADNCPDLGNADQADEDGDQLGDRCDLCPHVSESSPVDGDGDGIGNACDPSASKETLWLFEGFRGGVPAWARSSNWAAVDDGDNVRVSARGGSSGDAEFLVLPLDRRGRTFDNFRIIVTATLEQTVSADFPGIGFSVLHQNTDESLFCELYQVGADTSERYLGLDDDFGAETTTSFPWQTSAVYTITLTRSGANYTCRATGPNGSQMTALRSQIVPASGTAVEIWAFGMTAKLDWVHVVGP